MMQVKMLYIFTRYKIYLLVPFFKKAAKLGKLVLLIFGKRKIF